MDTRPTSKGQVQQFLGLANHYRSFICRFASIAKPLHRLTRPGLNGPVSVSLFSKRFDLKHSGSTNCIIRGPNRGGRAAYGRDRDSKEHSFYLHLIRQPHKFPAITILAVLHSYHTLTYKRHTEKAVQCGVCVYINSDQRYIA